MSQEQFKKFINPKNNAAIKEKFKQEKKVAKKERAEAINKRFEEKRALRNAGYSAKAPMPVTPEKADKRQKYPQSAKPSTDKPFAKEFTRPQHSGNRPRPTENGQRSTDFKRPPVKGQGQTGNVQRYTDHQRPPANAQRPSGNAQRSTDRQGPPANGQRPPGNAQRSTDRQGPPAKGQRPTGNAQRSTDRQRPSNYGPRTTGNVQRSTGQRPPTNAKRPAPNRQQPTTSTAQMPLNKYIAHCGITSRRDAIPLIKEGKIMVNGNVVNEPGFKVSETDTIVFNGKKLFVTKNLVYILLNKPKDYITTTDDPQGRKTVLELIKQATSERVYPIGRLDRNTSGVLLFTNDGELTQMLTHPSYNVKKVYEAKLDKPLVKAHFEKILNGLTLEDGEIHADALAYADAKDRSVIGIEIHSGRNRIVRRIFEHLGYEVKALDRVMYANLTKKNVDRGKWRYLSEKEIRLLKFMNSAGTNLPKSKAKEQII